MTVAKNRQFFKFKFRQLVFGRIKPKVLTNRLIVKNVSELYTIMLGKIPEVCNLFANFVEFTQFRKKSRIAATFFQISLKFAESPLKFTEPRGLKRLISVRLKFVEMLQKFYSV